MTAGTRFIPAPVRPTRASVRFAPCSAPLTPGPDDPAPAFVLPSTRRVDDGDALASSGPVGARDAEQGAKHAEPGAAPTSGTDMRMHAAIRQLPSGR